MSRPPSAPVPEPKAESGPLSVQLRNETHLAHVSVEKAFDLEGRLSSLATYADLLRALRGFYGPMEDSLVRLQGWQRLAPAVDISSRTRAVLIDEDLDALPDGYLPRTRKGQPLPHEPVSLASGLGALYVLEGSVLGGRVVAARARSALGPEVPVAFFTAAGRADLGGRWSSLLVALDSFGLHTTHEVRSTVVTSALSTFTCLRDHLSRLGADA